MEWIAWKEVGNSGRGGRRALVRSLAQCTLQKVVEGEGGSWFYLEGGTRVWNSNAGGGSDWKERAMQGSFADETRDKLGSNCRRGVSAKDGRACERL